MGVSAPAGHQGRCIVRESSADAAKRQAVKPVKRLGKPGVRRRGYSLRRAQLRVWRRMRELYASVCQRRTASSARRAAVLIPRDACRPG
jgi:hypothetical protein